MAHFPGTPKLEFRNCPETVPVGVLGHWELITLDCKVWSWQGLNQSYSPRWDLFNVVLHSQFGGREEVDSRLLVVGGQTASLTPGPSLAHNLGCKCPNDQCEGILDIYTSRPFKKTQCEVFWPLLLNSKHSGVLEDSNFPTLGMLGLTPHTWQKWDCDTLCVRF
jgi:hypothetical protein